VIEIPTSSLRVLNSNRHDTSTKMSEEKCWQGQSRDRTSGRQIWNYSVLERVLTQFATDLRRNTRPKNDSCGQECYLKVALKPCIAAPFVGMYPPATMLLSLSPPP
jgi:hypothetical protein